MGGVEDGEVAKTLACLQNVFCFPNAVRFPGDHATVLRELVSEPPDELTVLGGRSHG